MNAHQRRKYASWKHRKMPLGSRVRVPVSRDIVTDKLTFVDCKVVKHTKGHNVWVELITGDRHLYLPWGYRLNEAVNVFVVSIKHVTPLGPFAVRPWWRQARREAK